MRGIVIEGIPGSGKTTLIRAMVAALAVRHTGPLWIAAEHLTERPLEPLAQAAPEAVRSRIEAHLSLLERIRSLEDARFRDAGAETIFVLERFHFSLCQHVPGLSNFPPNLPPNLQVWLAAVEQRLAACGAGLLLCVIPPERVLQCSILETIASRNFGWKRYLETIGANEAPQAAHFSQEQEAFKERFAASRLEKKLVEVREQPLAEMTELAEKVLGWLLE